MPDSPTVVLHGMGAGMGWGRVGWEDGELSPHRGAVWPQGERIRLRMKEIRNFWRRNPKQMLGWYSRYPYSQPCQAVFCWKQGLLPHISPTAMSVPSHSPAVVTHR